jgi:hypothetical protein
MTDPSPTPPTAPDVTEPQAVEEELYQDEELVIQNDELPRHTGVTPPKRPHLPPPMRRFEED